MFQLLDQLCPLFEKDEMRLVLLSHASTISFLTARLPLFFKRVAQPGSPESIRL